MAEFEFKRSKNQVGYTVEERLHPDGQRCALCKYVENLECKKVSGEFNPNGWCHYFPQTTIRRPGSNDI